MKQILYHKYEVLRTIAEGGQGTVFLVKDLHLDRLAAVKVSKTPEKKGTKVAQQELLYRELALLKKLKHPALPSILDFFVEREQVFLVMEYVEGITLEQYLRKEKKVEEEKAVKWALELTEVLLYLHHERPPVIYGDLKPSNIIIGPEGHVRLIDFGAALTACYGKEREAVLMGTPGYSPPELWERKEVSRLWDIYGLGAVMHEMLTGLSPAFSCRKARPVREYDRSISPGLEKVISKCLSIKKSDRFQTMEQVKEALLTYRKKDRIREKLRRAEWSLGMALWLIALARTFLPFLRGVEESRLPFPYFIRPLQLCGAAFLYQVLVLGRGCGKRAPKQEKSVFLTEKKFSGLYGMFGMLMGLMLSCYLGILPVHEVHAEEVSEERFSEERTFEEKEALWVELKDGQSRKLLLKEDAVYKPGDRVRLELPLQELPEKKLALWLTARGEEGELYESRVFLIESGN